MNCAVNIFRRPTLSLSILHVYHFLLTIYHIKPDLSRQARKNNYNKNFAIFLSYFRVKWRDIVAKETDEKTIYRVFFFLP